MTADWSVGYPCQLFQADPSTQLWTEGRNSRTREIPCNTDTVLISGRHRSPSWEFQLPDSWVPAICCHPITSKANIFNSAVLLPWARGNVDLILCPLHDESAQNFLPYLSRAKELFHVRWLGVDFTEHKWAVAYKRLKADRENQSPLPGLESGFMMESVVDHYTVRNEQWA